MKIENVIIDGINLDDYPDFCDAYISYAEIDGKPATEEQLDQLNEDADFVYEKVLEELY